MTEAEIKLLYLFRDKLTRELWEMSKNDETTKSQMTDFTYQKLTNIISTLDERRV